MPAGVAQAHALAQALASDEIDVAGSDAAARIDGLFAQLAAESPLLAYAGSVERIADDVPRLVGELAWARTAIAEATTYNEDLRAAVEDLRAAVERGGIYQTDLIATLERKEGELVAAHTLLDRMRERLIGRMLLRGIERKGK